MSKNLRILLCVSALAASSGLLAQCDTLRAYVDYYNRVYLTCDAPSQLTETSAGEASLNTPRPLTIRKDSKPTPGILVPADTSRLSLIPSGSNARPVKYVVRPKETAFRIARRFFNMPIEALMMINGLSSTDLQIGQELHVGWYAPNNKTAMRADHLSVNDRVADSLASERIAFDPFHGESPVTNSATAYWDKDFPDEGNLFALHKTARINSYIEITNPMFGRKVLVKVIGRIPSTYRRDVQIVVSPGVARELGVIDSRFYVRLRYVK